MLHLLSQYQHKRDVTRVLLLAAVSDIPLNKLLTFLNIPSDLLQNGYDVNIDDREYRATMGRAVIG